MQNKGYQTDWLYQLKAKNNIVDIVSKYVHLERKGKNYWGLCPFHGDKNPSFSVNAEEGFFHCFACKESGDVISFVQKIESCDFVDAIKILADNAHMSVPEFTGDKEVSKKKEEKQRLLKLLDLAYKHYQENLYLPTAKKAQEYIKMRGFTKRELDDFKIGYSQDWTEMVSYLRAKGFTYKELVDAGVAQEKNNRYYDVMAQRLIFPIFNSFNECIGFTARVLEKTDFAKYKNTAETMLFQKGRVVFGINLLKALKQSGKLDYIIICEGSIDVIAMHRAGFKSTVACMGTALTQENAHELKKICDKVVLCFDGDEAGQKATIRSIDILKDAGFSIKVVALPDNMDPDEILKNKGKQFLLNQIENAKPVQDYLIDVQKAKYDLSIADQKGKFVKAVLENLRKISQTEAEPYLDKLRELTNIPIDILRRELVNAPKQQQKASPSVEKVEGRENGSIRAIKFVLASLIHQKRYVKNTIDYSKLMPFYSKIIEIAEKNTPISSYFDIFDVDNNQILKDALFYNFDQVGQAEEKYFEECLWILCEELLLEKQKQLNEDFKNCQDLTKRTEILKQLAFVTKQLKEKSLEEFYVRQ